MDDTRLLRILMDRFEAHPLLSVAQLGLSVEDGVAVISGFTASGTVKAIAEMLVIETPGVRAVANEIETCEGETWRYVDCHIAKKTCDLLEWNSLTPGGLRVKVEHGRLAISGRVESQRKLEAIIGVLLAHSGAKSIDNYLKVVEEAHEPEERFILDEIFA